MTSDEAAGVPRAAVNEWQIGRLDGKTALITGAARGIGRATVACFADHGARVIAVDLTLDVPVENGGRPEVEWVEGDTADPDAMAHAAGLAGRHGGRLDICVANAGVGGVEDFLDGSAESWTALLRVNMLGTMVALQAAARTMVADGKGGCLLATGSIAGLRGEPSAPAYGASKGGVMALMRSLAVELAPHGIRANAVAPGQIDTELNAVDVATLSIRAGVDPDRFRSSHLEAQVPAGRMGRPEEVAALLAFLASDAAAYVTGETVRIDGGELSV